MTLENGLSPFKFIIKSKHDQENIHKLHLKSFKTSLKDKKSTDHISKNLKENSNKFIHIQKFENKKPVLCNKETSKLENSLIKWKTFPHEDIIQSDNEELPIISTNTNNSSNKKKIKNPFIVYNPNKILEKNPNNHFIPYIFSNIRQKTLNTKSKISFIKTFVLPSSNKITQIENSLSNWSPSKKKNAPFLEKGLAKTMLNWIIEYQSQNTLRNYSNNKTENYIFIVTETKKDENMNNIYFYGYKESTRNIEILFLLTGKYLTQNEINEGTVLSLYEPITRFQNIFSQDIIICIHWNYYKNIE
ncbi:hypothetical protein PCANB_002346 [Pneumocystis canis]|nr:hypothetical protein PCK1_002374 [Pneumocystis canis]KAG5439015.1 hypothetical protein PCANB_002346 [Pneumocystis canis]